MRPFRVLLCILSTFAVLAAVCAVFAGKSEVVRVPSLASVLSLPQQVADTMPIEPTPVDTLPVLADTVPAQSEQQPLADTTPVKPVPTELPKALPQTKLQLPAFYAALGKADQQMVRVVHFGDSQIEEDRISMILRRRLQERFGGGGIGLVPMVQTIPTYTAKQTLEQDGHEIPYTTVRRYLAYGPSSMRLKDDNRYGPMAQLASIDQPVDVRIELLRDRVPTNDFDRVRVLCTDSVTVIVDPDSVPAQLPVIALDEPRRDILLHIGGTGCVYGISLETAIGVQVDNIPMRGAAGTNFTTMARQPFAAFFSETNTALVIMQFGGNAMPAIRTQAAVEKYVASMRQQIHFMMSAAPNASLLFIGPSDMITTVEGEQMTYPMLPLLDRMLAEMVAEEGGAYYSLFRLMGGAGSMFSWKEKGLAGEDMIHFTRAGAKKVGEMLAKQILEDYDQLSALSNQQSAVSDTINSDTINSEAINE